MNKIQVLDGWRAGAILCVLIAHFIGERYLNLGRVGVELFFVLSGRLMADLLFVRQHEIARFLKRRVSRVWPALYVFVIVIANLADLPYRSIVYALTFTNNYASAFGYRIPYLDHLWSLCIEEHTYIFLAMLAYCVRRYPISPIHVSLLAAVICMINGVIQSWHGGNYYAVYWRTDTRAASILISCALFLLVRKYDWQLPSPAIVGLGILGLTLNIDQSPDWLKYTAGTFCFALTVSTIEKTKGFIYDVLCSKILGYIGLLSFSLYLWQQPFSEMIHDYSRVTLLFAVFAVGSASYYIIEKPSREWLNQRWSKREILY